MVSRKRSAPSGNEQTAPAAKKSRATPPSSGQDQQVAAPPTTSLGATTYLQEALQCLSHEEVDRLRDVSSVVDDAVERMGPSRQPKHLFHQLEIKTVGHFYHPTPSRHCN
jgi:hypothetical protein